MTFIATQISVCNQKQKSDKELKLNAETNLYMMYYLTIILLHIFRPNLQISQQYVCYIAKII